MKKSKIKSKKNHITIHGAGATLTTIGITTTDIIHIIIMDDMLTDIVPRATMVRPLVLVVAAIHLRAQEPFRNLHVAEQLPAQQMA